LIATDWAEYAVEIQEELGAQLHARPDWRPISKFEKKAINEGRKVAELTIDHKATLPGRLMSLKRKGAFAPCLKKSLQ
jgi:tRNA G46 methylase TrmB